MATIAAVCAIIAAAVTGVVAVAIEAAIAVAVVVAMAVMAAVTAGKHDTRLIAHTVGHNPSGTANAVPDFKRHRPGFYFTGNSGHWKYTGGPSGKDPGVMTKWPRLACV